LNRAAVGRERRGQTAGVAGIVLELRRVDDLQARQRGEQQAEGDAENQA
jgi:hypothetical protein